MSSAWVPIDPVEPRMSRRFASGIRGPDVVADDSREQHRVQTIQRAAMGAEHPAGVLRVSLALDERLKQIADRRHERNAEAEHERVAAGQPVLVAPGEPY